MHNGRWSSVFSTGWMYARHRNHKLRESMQVLLSLHKSVRLHWLRLWMLRFIEKIMNSKFTLAYWYRTDYLLSALEFTARTPMLVNLARGRNHNILYKLKQLQVGFNICNCTFYTAKIAWLVLFSLASWSRSSKTHLFDFVDCWFIVILKRQFFLINR